ncbi:MAG: CGNR zinc finger domain-containing protein [Anaerolineae bacterium]
MLSWGACRRGSISEEYGERLLNTANAHPDEAETVLAQAITLRETLFRIFDAAAHAQLPQGDDLALFNAELRAPCRMCGWCTWRPFPLGVQEDPDDLSAAWWAVLRSAADLLTTPNACSGYTNGNDHCDWLFVDTTKNHSRRWCDMNVNLHTARKHRQRQQK